MSGKVLQSVWKNQLEQMRYLGEATNSRSQQQRCCLKYVLKLLTTIHLIVYNGMSNG